MALVLVSVLAVLLVRALAPESPSEVCDALARGRITHLVALDGVEVRCDAVRLEPPTDAVRAALAAPEPDALVAWLREQKGTALALVPEAPLSGIGARLAALAHVVGLRALVLSPELAVYAPMRELALSSEERDAVAYVARALFRGAREPSVASFPPALRRVERVEVIVMLTVRGEPRLWRSARGTSIARALLTATRVARDRWREREQAMGGPLAKRLLELDVEVSLLSEDGTLLSTQRAFVNDAVTHDHGIGFDYRTAWHYVLPADVARRKTGAFGALTEQITEQGLTTAILSQSDTRVYRFVTVPLGVSKAPLDVRAAEPEEP